MTDTADPKPKNIIICSDGTGNSGGGGNPTNVWRLYEALAKENTKDGREQLAIHDNGVGTQQLKPLQIMGSAVGLGISRNLAQLYSFLMQHFNEGDRIYLFGFSRGAFTARTLANMLYYCGIADRHNEEGAARTPEVINDIARRAVTAYRRRDWKAPDEGDPFEFRKHYGLVHKGENAQYAAYQKNRQGRFHITFLGVWDTVDAVGLPVDELTQFCCKLGAMRLPKSLRKIPPLNRMFGVFPVMNQLFGHVLRRPVASPVDKNNELTWEDDLHRFILRACHAASLDDERYTFHPTMFLEREDPERAEQVWFPGVHSNVGGGYPKDGLALVPLVWMMKHAEKAGLAFSERFDEYQRDADEHGPQYDSRAIGGMFYRYCPRDLKDLCRNLRKTIDGRPNNAEPKIHGSVLRRIHRQVNGYAPTGLPRDYEYSEFEPKAKDKVHRPLPHEVLPNETLLEESDHSEPLARKPLPVEYDRDCRDELHERTRDLIWWRRIQYYVFIIWVLFWAAEAACLELLAPERLNAWFTPFVPAAKESWFWPAIGLAAFAVGAVWFIIAGLWRNHGPNSNTPSRLRYAQTFGLVGSTGLLTAGILYLHTPIMDLLNWMLPDVLTGLCEELKRSPTATLLLFVGTYWLIFADRALRDRIATLSFAAWQSSLHRKVARLPCAGMASLFLGFASLVRKKLHPNRAVLAWKWKYGPLLLFFVFILAIGAAAWLLLCADSSLLSQTEWCWGCINLFLISASLTTAALVPVLLGAVCLRRWRRERADRADLSNARARIDEGRLEDPVSVTFSTKCRSFDTGVRLQKDCWYLVGVSPCTGDREPEPLSVLLARLDDTARYDQPRSKDEAARLKKEWQWRDKSLPATPNGLLKSEMTWGQRLFMWFFTPTRRCLPQPWFRLLGNVDRSESIILIGTASLFRAPADGNLRLFVNDAERFYDNNEGEAIVQIYSCNLDDE